MQISYSGSGLFQHRIPAQDRHPADKHGHYRPQAGWIRTDEADSRQGGASAGPFSGVDIVALDSLEKSALENPFHKKEARPVGSRKTDSILPLFDCAKAPCQDGGCPINQQIPVYLRLVDEGKYAEAFKTIAIDNSSPAVTGTICDHQCQHVCTRLDYEHPLQIREMKKIAVLNAQDGYVSRIRPTGLKTRKKVAVVGAGPAGVGTALFLRRNGMEARVFERRAEPYGIVRYAIPDFRIGADMIARDVEMARKHGVEFEFGSNQSGGRAQEQIRLRGLATGAWKPGACP